MRIKVAILVSLILLMNVNVASAGIIDELKDVIGYFLGNDKMEYYNYQNIKTLNFNSGQNVIMYIEFTVNPDINITGFVYVGSREIPYQIKYHKTGWFSSQIVLDLDGVVKIWNISNDYLGSAKTIVVSYAINATGYGMLGLYYDDNIFKPGTGTYIENGAYNPMTKITMISDKEVNVKIGTTDYLSFAEGYIEFQNIQTGNYTDTFTIWNLLEFAQGSFVIVSGVVYYFKLIFIDNGLLTFALFEAFALAWSAGTSRNIWSFYRKFIRVHVALFEFLLNVIRTVIEIFYMIIQAIKPF